VEGTGGPKWSPGGSLDQWSQIPITFIRVRIRIKVKSWIRIRIYSEKLNPKPHLSEKLDPDPDKHERDADPQPWLQTLLSR
jgi:hypothetical protein